MLGALLILAAWVGNTRLDAAEIAAGTPTLTNFQQVIALGLAGVQETVYPVRVRGVVAYPAHGTREMFHIHDGTNGLGVSLLTLPGTRLPLLGQPQLGDRVEIVGETGAGSSHPFITRATARILGPGGFGPPLSARTRDLAAGKHHGAIVRLRASVLDVSRVRGSIGYLLSADGYNFHVSVGEPANRLPIELLNATVDVQGMPWLQLDGVGRATSFRVFTCSNSWVQVVSPGSSNLFAGPRRTLAALSNAPLSDERFVVSGVVTYAWPAHFVAVEDATGAAISYPFQPIAKAIRDGDYVPRPTGVEIRSGDLVEAVATRNADRAYSPQLRDVELRVIGRQALPLPPTITEKDAFTGRYDARRVRIIGRVVDRDYYTQFGAKVSRLWLKVGEQTTYGVYAGQKQVEFTPPNGARIELTGLCVTSAGAEGRVRSFNFYISSPDDVRALPEPPAWLTATALRIAGLATFLIALALGWVWLLRRQVARQTSDLRASHELLEAEAVERKRAQTDLIAALARERELGELKTNFVSIVSHEFRTPLEIIVSSADILARYLDRLPPEERVEHLEAIQRSVKRMSGMMEDVLLLGRFENAGQQFRPDDVHLAALARRVADEIRSATGNRCPLRLSCDETLPLAQVDENLVRHILTNLLSNAVKFSAPGSPVELNLVRAGTEAVFTVRDHGAGIPVADQPRLYEAFHRGRNAQQIPGTGLGLVIVRRSVDLHGGHIEVISEEGRGTTFTVRLPVFPQNDSLS